MNHAHSDIKGKKTILGIMPDWNPAGNYWCLSKTSSQLTSIKNLLLTMFGHTKEITMVIENYEAFHYLLT